MSTPVTVPHDLWNDGEAVISSWLVSDGAAVEQGALIAEILVEKAQFEIAAPASGTITLAKAEEELVDKGEVIAAIG